MRATILVLGGLLIMGGRLEAQRQAVPMRASSVWAPAERAEGPLALKVATGAAQQSYWLEGLIIGGVLGGAAGAIVAAGGCSDTDSGYSGGCAGPTIVGVLVGALLGAVPGVLIGGRFHKKPKTVPAS